MLCIYSLLSPIVVFSSYCTTIFNNDLMYIRLNSISSVGDGLLVTVSQFWWVPPDIQDKCMSEGGITNLNVSTISK